MSLFALSEKEATEQRHFAMLHPVTAEGMQLEAFQTTLENGVVVYGVLFFILVVATFYSYKKRKELFFWIWISYVATSVAMVVVAKEKLEELKEASYRAQQIAVEKAQKIIAEENANKKLFDVPSQVQVDNKNLITSEQIKELMPKAPATRNIDLNCSSVSSGYATCSGTVTDR